eukprot:121639-Chlamydomonas_euryale.AAC.10
MTQLLSPGSASAIHTCDCSATAFATATARPLLARLALAAGLCLSEARAPKGELICEPMDALMRAWEGLGLGASAEPRRSP